MYMYDIFVYTDKVSQLSFIFAVQWRIYRTPVLSFISFTFFFFYRYNYHLLFFSFFFFIVFKFLCLFPRREKFMEEEEILPIRNLRNKWTNGCYIYIYVYEYVFKDGKNKIAKYVSYNASDDYARRLQRYA